MKKHFKIQYAIISSYDFKDIKPHFIGEEQCLPGNKSMVAHPQYYSILHYVVSGKGIVYKNNKAYPVEAGEAFLIRPGELATYVADTEDPWCYQWLGYHGELATKMCALDDVFKFPGELMSEMFEYINTPMSEFKITTVLHKMYVKLMQNENIKYNYVRETKDYIKASYMHPIKITHIAQQLHINPQYLSRLFKSNTGISIQQYIINIRMREAKSYLIEGYTVENTAHLTGYDDTSNFSKIFKREVGVSPQQYKKHKADNNL